MHDDLMDSNDREDVINYRPNKNTTNLQMSATKKNRVANQSEIKKETIKRNRVSGYSEIKEKIESANENTSNNSFFYQKIIKCN